MNKLTIVLIGVGAVLFCVTIGIGNTPLTIIGFCLFAAGVLLIRTRIRG